MLNSSMKNEHEQTLQLHNKLLCVIDSCMDKIMGDIAVPVILFVVDNCMENIMGDSTSFAGMLFPVYFNYNYDNKNWSHFLRSHVFLPNNICRTNHKLDKAHMKDELLK